ncbi:cation-transporting P-type ATPase [bacterium]|nr:cation-transporting P-type ATPase [bacterium]
MYYQKDYLECLKELGCTAKEGLSDKEIEKRRQEFGPNIISKVKKKSVILRFLSYFLDLFALMLILAAIVSFVFSGDTGARDGFLILGIVIINSTISFIQEFKAEKMMEALSKVLPKTTIVLRKGKEAEISREDIVPGDIVILNEGDDIPADGRIIEVNGLYTNDFTMTGESVPQEKILEPIKGKISLTDMDNMVFAGTSVAKGNAKVLVTATGMNTEFGKIAKITQDLGEDKSTLQKELIKAGRTIAKFAVVIGLLIFFINLGMHKPFSASLIFAISLGVAMVPEGLPTTISVALSLAVKRMATRKALVKKLSSVETLGSATVICSDKTGTITKNEMTVKEVIVDFRDIHVKGVGYEPNGGFTENDIELKKLPSSLIEIIKAGALCSNANLVEADESADSRWSVLGDPTEGALITLARKAGISEKDLAEENKEVYEIPFTSDRKMMSSVVENNDGRFVYSKGAPGEILKNCTHIKIGEKIEKIEKYNKDIIKKIDENARLGLRVLALATKEISEKEKFVDAKIESNLIFIGLVGMIDPPKDGVSEAIVSAKQAGIRIFMITGDYGLTAGAIAEHVGIVERNKYAIITGSDLHKMSDKELSRVVSSREVVFARTSPDQKIRIVSILQDNGEVVAVTGDGVNDAPALKKADIGVAMGIAGTDVSKEAADMILLDDNFRTIVAAIEEGRVVYDNLKKFVRFVFIANIGELFAPLVGLALNLPLPLLAIQVLAVDLGMEVLPSLALAVDAKEKDVMTRAPRDQKERLLNKKMIIDFSTIGAVAGIGAGLAFFVTILDHGWTWGKEIVGDPYYIATTVTYTSLAFAQIVNVIFTHQKKTLESFKNNPYLPLSIIGTLGIVGMFIYLPLFQNFLNLRPLDLDGYLLALSVAFVVLIVGKIKFYVSENKKFKKYMAKQSI